MKIHYRGVEGATPCGAKGTATNDTDLVTCATCLSRPATRAAAAQFRDVVEALAYPKEEHPCLKNHQP